MQSVNPATGEVLDTYETHSTEAVEDVLDTAESAFVAWRERPLREREQLLVALAETLRDGKLEYAQLMTREMGKPMSQAVGEVEKCAWLCEHYAETANASLDDKTYPSPPGTDVRTRYEPLGPTLAVMPWNFPFWQVLRFAVPAIAAGNVALLSHAPEVPGCALAVEHIFEEAGAPDGVFQTVLTDPETIHDQLLPDDRIRAVTVTGSSKAGSAVAATAGDHLKKSVLELGGSDPFLVLEDADIDAAAETAVDARLQNNGQSCIAAKRILVTDDIYDEFADAFLAEFDDRQMGDPMDEETDVGPLVARSHRDRLHEQVQKSVEAGATLRRGGELPDGDGAFYPPTVLTDVPEGCPADSQETFGPVAVLYRVPNEDAAIKLANDTEYGLGASLWTENRERGRRLADRIDAGAVFVNEMSKSDPRVPFGGIKRSGYGRELGPEGIREFVNKKTVWVE